MPNKQQRGQIFKGNRIRQIIPLAVDGITRLGRYVDAEGLPCQMGDKGAHFVANIQQVDLPLNFEVYENPAFRQ